MKKSLAVLLIFALLCVGVSALAAVGEGTELIWDERALLIQGIAECDAVDSGAKKAEGRFIEITIATNLRMKFGEISVLQEQLTLADETGQVYSPVSVSGTLGESASMDKLDAARLSNITVRFDVPKEIALSELSLCVNGVAVSGGEIGGGIPEELVGDWAGSGEPVGGGSAISLNATVNADGTGSYTFEQADYTESYPITLSSGDSKFAVAIPEDNELGIVSCEGTYSYLDGVLTLNITTTFAGGGTFNYVANCKKVANTEYSCNS